MFHYLLDKVQQKLAGWKHRMLSWAARLLLIRTVTSTIPGYVMGVCRLPARTIEDLEKINRRFFWSDTAQHNSTHVISWEQICQPRDQGGLGLWPLRTQNWVILAKLAWRVITDNSSFWSQVLHQKYQLNEHGVSTVGSSLHSSTWKGIVYGMSLLEQGLH